MPLVTLTLDDETQRFFNLKTNLNGSSQNVKVDKLYIEPVAPGEHILRIECSITLKNEIKKPGEPG